MALKAANPKTRCFDVSWISQHPGEEEKLIMGSSLKIIEILIENKSSRYIKALGMLEEILNGHFVSGNKQTQRNLYDLIVWMLNFEGDFIEDPPSQYIQALFDKIVNNIEQIWINENDIDRFKYQELRYLFSFETSKSFFVEMNIEPNEMKHVEEVQWIIDKNIFKNFITQNSRQYIESEARRYYLKDINDSVEFHLECCYKYSDQSPKVALFLHLDKLPDNVEGIRVEYDLLCIYGKKKKEKYIQRMLPQLLSTTDRITNNNTYKQNCGFQTIPSSLITKKTNKIQWKLAVKISKIIFPPDAHKLNKEQEYMKKIAELEGKLKELEVYKTKNQQSGSRQKFSKIKLSLKTSRPSDDTTIDESDENETDFERISMTPSENIDLLQSLTTSINQNASIATLDDEVTTDTFPDEFRTSDDTIGTHHSDFNIGIKSIHSNSSKTGKYQLIDKALNEVPIRALKSRKSTAIINADVEYQGRQISGSTAIVSDSDMQDFITMDSDEDEESDTEFEEDMIFLSQLEGIKDAELMEIFTSAWSREENRIIFDSLLSVYSRESGEYVDVAGILTKQCLYIVSAVRYKVWEEFQIRTRINDIINSEHTLIVENMAIKLVNNLDEFQNLDKRRIQKHVLPYLIGKTRQDLKLDIILSQKRFVSIQSLLGMKGLRHNHGSDGITDKGSKVIDLSIFNVVQSEELEDIGYGFSLRKNIKSHITFDCTSNNTRHEWLTHLDYAINGELFAYSDVESERTKDGLKYKYVNDFAYFVNDNHERMRSHDSEDDELKGEFVTNFNFGQEFNYWQDGFTNSIIPIYNTLKQELLNNNISKLSKSDYYALYSQCDGLVKAKKHKLLARDIGHRNQTYGIEAGKEITINHVIAIKLYTDYGAIASEFKLHCRKCNENEPINELMERNSEIANWCRYLREACLFYGSDMGDDIFYTRMTNKLIFEAMRQKIECPMSATTQLTLVLDFCDDDDIVLALKQDDIEYGDDDGYRNTYFDCSWVSSSKYEEKLIMGEKMKVVDIYIKKESYKEYVSALRIFDDIIEGIFIDPGMAHSERYLYKLLAHHLGLESMDNLVSPYIAALFDTMIQKMQNKHQNQELWMNFEQIKRMKHKTMREFLSNEKNMEYYLGIKLSEEVKEIQQFEWLIDGDDFEHFCQYKPREYGESNPFLCKLSDIDDSVNFSLEAYYQTVEESDKVGLVFNFDMQSVPSYVDNIEIDYELICNLNNNKNRRNNIFHQIKTKQKIFRDVSQCGSETFSNVLFLDNDATSIRWTMAIKVISISFHEEKESENDDNNNTGTRSLESINERLILGAIKQHDDDLITRLFMKLLQENKIQKEEIQRLKSAMKNIIDLKDKISSNTNKIDINDNNLGTGKSLDPNDTEEEKQIEIAASSFKKATTSTSTPQQYAVIKSPLINLNLDLNPFSPSSSSLPNMTPKPMRDIDLDKYFPTTIDIGTPELSHKYKTHSTEKVSHFRRRQTVSSEKKVIEQDADDNNNDYDDDDPLKIRRGKQPSSFIILEGGGDDDNKSEILYNEEKEVDLYKNGTKRRIMARDESVSEGNNIIDLKNINDLLYDKELPNGWKIKYSASGLLMYINKNNQIAQFNHPLQGRARKGTL